MSLTHIACIYVGIGFGLVLAFIESSVPHRRLLWRIPIVIFVWPVFVLRTALARALSNPSA
jgi:hypothetical protein